MVTTTQTTSSPTTHADYDALKGRDVFSADGEKLGSIDAIFHPEQVMPAAKGGHYVLVKPGLLKNWFGGGEEVYVPETAIAAVTGVGVTLAFPKEAVEGRGWDTPPARLDSFTRA